MRILLAALAALLLGSGAEAGDDLCQLLQPCRAPAKYRTGPFIAPPVVRHVDYRSLQTLCGGVADAARGAGVMGCAELIGRSCVVIMTSEIRDISPALYKLVLDHELAHCRGWVHHHYQ